MIIVCHCHPQVAQSVKGGWTLLMFNFKETDFLMSSQCHLLVHFKLIDPAHDHKEKPETREWSFFHFLNGYF